MHSLHSSRLQFVTPLQRPSPVFSLQSSSSLGLTLVVVGVAALLVVVAALLVVGNASMTFWRSWRALQILESNPFENGHARMLYEEWLNHPGSEEAKKHLHTQYHLVLKSITAQLHN